MGNWNRHFVRVGSDGNVGLFDNNSNEIFYTANGNAIFSSNPFYIGGKPFHVANTSGLYIDSVVSNINGITGSLLGVALLSGSPDLRIGVTAADASPITIFSSTVSGTRYEVKARILATAGISATYTITWTEGGAARTVALTVTAAGTEYHDNFVIAPDAGTNITAQITSLTSSTVNVDAIVSVLG